jgi:cyanophycinase-like exopeptidase
MKLFYLIFLVSLSAYSQNYTSFFVGSSNDVSTNPQFGICLMGGASENDAAMQWFLNLADGGDVVVIRTSGSDGYNDYMFNQLGVNLNSVETIRIENANGALDAYVLQKISQAEAIWFAGGDQSEYVSFFKNTDFEDAINTHINVKQYPIGGISSGMAIMGEYYFDALNGTVTSAEALNNPYNSKVSLGVSDFVDVPFLSNTITDTHYDNPDRKGRQSVFLARLQELTGERVYGIGLDEFTAACIDSNGIAHVYGEYPTFNDTAYFVQINCLDNTIPENLSPSQALEWNLNQEAIKAYIVQGNASGSNSFDLNTWESGNGGTWENWWVNQGTLGTQSSNPIDCENLSLTGYESPNIAYYPNPVKDILKLRSNYPMQSISIYDMYGRSIKKKHIHQKYFEIDTKDLQAGTYLLEIELTDIIRKTYKIIVE